MIFRTEKIDRLTEAEVRQMYALFEQHYDAVSFEQFEVDLSEKDYVVVLEDGASHRSTLVGFSTLAVMELEFENRQLRALFSGDTIIRPDHWGEQKLPTAWCHLAGQIKAESPELPLYWFLIVKGHRTYRYLPAFAKRYYPTWRWQTPPFVERLMAHLGRLKFGSAYQSSGGVIRFEQSKGHLKGVLASIPDKSREKPDVKFFLEKNPNYAKGEELVCLTELKEENMRSVARKSFVEGMESYHRRGTFDSNVESLSNLSR